MNKHLLGRPAASKALPVVNTLLLELCVQPLRVCALHMHVHSSIVANEGSAVGLPEVHLKETDQHSNIRTTFNGMFGYFLSNMWNLQSWESTVIVGI